jgi:hypothetical protein
MRESFDDYETCEVTDGSSAIHPHHLGLLMLRDISSTGHFAHAKHCVINEFDTDYLLSADDVMDNIRQLDQNIEEQLP